VTGARGFLGSHLSRALTAAGADVYPFIRPAGDVTDRQAFRTAIASARPDVIVHLAAYGTTTTQRDAVRMREVNVGGVENLWAALGSTDARLIQTGSCAEYALKDGALSEDDPCIPDSEYGRSLHEAVSYSQAMAARSGRELVVLRPFGPYGPGDRPERVIPFVIRGLLGTGRVAVTAGRQRRDFSYVSDHVSAFVAAATVPLTQTARAYNIGSGCPITVRALVERIAALIGGDAIGRVDFGAAESRTDDRGDRYADITAAKRDLGFVPSVSLDEGLRLTIGAMR
jgi:UDP-glucose 4-epimerase